jgi:hypothetical protein
LDEEIARIAIGEALREALRDEVTFDPAAIDGNALRTATLAFVAEMVFVTVLGDASAALQAAPTPQAAAQRESSIRSLVREVTDHVGTPLLDAAGKLLSERSIRTVILKIVNAVHSEIATW